MPWTSDASDDWPRPVLRGSGRIQSSAEEAHMKPPYCHLCHKDCRCESWHFQTGGGYVSFSDFLPLSEGAVGHPRSMEWFCPVHLPAARALASKPLSEAMNCLKQEFGDFEPPLSYVPCPDPELWLTSVGPSRAKVFSIIRRVTGHSPNEVKALLEAGNFRIKAGWPVDLELRPIAEALQAIGASVVLRCP